MVSRERPKYGHEVDSSEEGLGVQAIWVGMVHDSSQWSGSFSIKMQTHPDTYETGNNQCLCGEGPGTFPSLLKEMIEDTLEQPDEEVHRVGSGQIPSSGASVPIESGAHLLECGCVLEGLQTLILPDILQRQSFHLQTKRVLVLPS